MGFDLHGDEQDHDNQLSLFEMPTMNFIETGEPVTTQIHGATVEGFGESSGLATQKTHSSPMDYHTWVLAHREPEQSKTSRFMTMSVALHATAILCAALITVPIVEQAKTEPITIEIEEAPTPRLQARGARVLPTQGGAPAAAIAPDVLSEVAKSSAADSGGADDVVVALKPSKTAKLAKAQKADSMKSPRKLVAAAKAGRSVAPKTNFKAVPMTIDDIEAPALDTGALAKVKVKSDMNEDFNEDFEKIDRSHKKSLADESAKINDLADAISAEQDDALKSLEEKNKEDSARFATIQKNLRDKDAQAIASARAAEKAAVAAAARDAAAREASARAAALAAANAKKSAGSGSGLGTGSGTGASVGAGAGNNGSATAGSQVSGVPSGVRSLDQLRQMPGNPRPQYDREERRRGDQGAVAFIGYVNREGFITKFQMTKSTGYRNLDAKTLKALKKWKFYPGQEGWVELPFRWDIKGGVQEDGGRLRTSVSQR